MYPVCTSVWLLRLWERDIGLIRETRFGRAVDLPDPGPILSSDPPGWLLRGSWGSDGPGPVGWCSTGALQIIWLAQRADAGEAAAQGSPVLLALPTQPLYNPLPDLISTPQQEVHQLHIWPVGAWKHVSFCQETQCFLRWLHGLDYF